MLPIEAHVTLAHVSWVYMAGCVLDQKIWYIHARIVRSFTCFKILTAARLKSLSSECPLFWFIMLWLRSNYYWNTRIFWTLEYNRVYADFCHCIIWIFLWLHRARQTKSKSWDLFMLKCCANAIFVDDEETKIPECCPTVH